MAVENNVDNIKAKFLWELGIRKNDYPIGFLDKIQDITKMISTTEIGFCAYRNYCDGKVEKFSMKDVVGTNHPRYVGKTWIDAFLDLDRGDNIIKLYEENPGYWQEMKSLDNADVGLIKCGDKYYIFDGAGGGNNRLITMKILYLAKLAKAKDNQEEIERINSEFTFAANVRELPKDKTIPFIVIALGEDLSEFDVRKENDIFIVTREFTEVELFKGDSEQLKTYFNSLFDKNVFGSKDVNSRLRNLQRACNFSGKEYREVLEAILPEFKSYTQGLSK